MSILMEITLCYTHETRSYIKLSYILFHEFILKWWNFIEFNGNYILQLLWMFRCDIMLLIYSLFDIVVEFPSHG